MGVEIAQLFARIGADLSGLENGLKRSGDMLNSTAAKMSQLGNKLSMNLTLPLAAMGAVAAKSFVDLDAAMRNIQSISKESDESIGQLQNTFVDLSTDITQTTDTAINLARGFYDIQSSGFAGADGMEVLLQSTKAATAGLSNTATAAKAITAKINAYGESAQEARATSDLMFRTVDRGVGSFEELAGSLSNVLPSAANAGIGFEEISAAIATLSKQGLSFSEATVSINQAILGLIDPSDELKEALAQLGYESGQAALDQLGLAGTLKMLTDAGYDSTEEMAQLFGNVRALRGVLGLTGRGAQLFTEDLAAMGNAAGATQQAFEIQSKSLAAQLKSLRNEALGLGMDMLSTMVPAFEDAVRMARQLFDWFQGLDPATQKLIVQFGLLAAAAGPALKIISTGATIFGALSTAGSAVAGVLAALPAFLANVGAGFQLLLAGESAFGVAATGAAGLTATLIPLAVAIGAIVAAYIKLRQTQQVAAEGVKENQDAWGQFFSQQISAGKNATAVADEYIAKQRQLQEVLANASLVEKAGVALFVGADKLTSSYGQLSQTLAATAASYDEYAASARQVAEANGLAIDSQGNLIQRFVTARGVVEKVIQANYLVAESAFEAGRAADEWGSWDREAAIAKRFAGEAEKVAGALEDVTEATEQATKPLIDLSEMMSIVQTRLSEAGGGIQDLDLFMRGLGVTIGTTTAEQEQLRSDLELLSDALSYGVINGEFFENAMKNAAQGMAPFGQATRAWLANNVQFEASLRGAAQAAQGLIEKQVGLAESLKGATQQQVAQTAISELGSLKEAGVIDFSTWLESVTSVQEVFGLADEKSRALAGGLIELTTALSEGELPASTFGAALKQLYIDSRDGSVDFEKILDMFGGDKTSTATKQLTDLSTSVLGITTTMTGLATDIATTFTGYDWTSVGGQIDAGLVAGINSGVPKIEAAAVAAAQAAYAAAMAALEAQSPSKKFAKLGEMADQGFAAGMSGGKKGSAAARMAMSGIYESAKGASGGGNGGGNAGTGERPLVVNQYYESAAAAGIAQAQIRRMRQDDLNRSMGG
jgi:TP901 family phage tail tape measure protein